ncbi:DUF2800 domain-containing protein [Acidovorax sp. PRC11]|uniref:DUF2800 domain-containing protein n=1 Tax=Acidovorax sp. PRC11 TaxID=2962592 RepID=UPI0028813537|nr:DUF2800 domain-containing protein [Acidovorax sp. PRC11]MDT0140189.1 DUF2800 domain-containing protein [Acidovorax sp. PRC11]
MSAHALLSPSSAARWMACPGSVAACEGLPDKSSEFADEGTAAHELAALCLVEGGTAADRIGLKIHAGRDGRVFTVDVDMATHVQAYVDYVRALVQSTGGELLVEQRLSIEHITGEPGARGTADAVILADGELIVADLKYGRGVPVDADDNPQLQIYALAALREFCALGDFRAVRLVIHQPRLGSVSEWAQPVAELEQFGQAAWNAAVDTRAADAPRVPGEKQCKFCRAKANCPSLAARVQQEVGADFEDLTAFDRAHTEAWTQKRETMPADQLGAALAAVDLIEMWCKAVRGEVETRLLAGVPVPGWKLVQGKRGNRRWTSEEEAEAVLKAMRVKHDQMYDYSLISPTTAEKLAKGNFIGPRQWPKVAALITQAEGKPSVAPETDKRPALVLSAVADDFDTVATEPSQEEAVSDLV